MPLNPKIFSYFKMADTNGNGSIDFYELQNALKNDAESNFRAETVRLMIAMFNTRGDAKILPAEFEKLWNYLIDWRKTFNRFDKDKNQRIDRGELHAALSLMGYKFSSSFINLALAKYDPDKTGAVRFDDFIRLCCILSSLSEQFTVRDKMNAGEFMVSYETFMTMVFSSAV